MDERGIIIADRDGRYRKELAEFFQEAGYAVETTDSAVHVLCSILEKQTPVLLLGSDFDKKVCSADLIHLLKKCNRNLHVIMVSDSMPLSQARQVRQEGIFYHALKPSTPGDTEEIGQAVASAFQHVLGEVSVKARALAQPVRTERVPAGEESGRRAGVCSCERGSAGAQSPARTIWWFVGLVVTIVLVSLGSVLAAERAMEGSSVEIWLFIAFCALIIVTQVLPIFRIKVPGGVGFVETVRHEDDSQEER